MKKELIKDGAFALTFGILNLVDYITTKKILKTGGDELNPIVNFLIKKKLFGFFKIITTVGCMFLIYKEENSKIASKILITVYTGLASNNIKEIINHNKEIKK